MKKIITTLCSLVLATTLYAKEPVHEQMERFLNTGDTQAAITLYQEGTEAVRMSRAIFDELEEAYDPETETGYFLFSRNNLITKAIKPKQKYREEDTGFAKAKLLSIDEKDSCRIIFDEYQKGNRFVGDYHNHPDIEGEPEPSSLFGMVGDVTLNHYERLKDVCGGVFTQIPGLKDDLAFIGGGKPFEIKGFVYTGKQNVPVQKERLALTKTGIETFIEVNRSIIGPGFDMAPRFMGLKYVPVPIDVLSAKEEFSIITKAIMSYHQAHTGLFYTADAPEIIFDEAMDYNDVAKYYVETKKIHLHPRYKDVNVNSLLTLLQVDNEKTREVREILSHELGHYLTDLYIEKHVPDSWLSHFFTEEFEGGSEEVDVYLVSEGIGEYFGKIFDKKQGAVFASSRWDASFDIEEFKGNNFQTWIFYMGGRDLVEPILKKYKHDGLMWLLQHELKVTPPDLSVVPVYQQDALEGLEFEKNARYMPPLRIGRLDFPHKYTELTPDTYEKFALQNRAIVLNCVDREESFYANCDELLSDIEQIIEYCPNLPVGILNKDNYPEFNYTQQILGDPQVIFFVDGTPMMIKSDVSLRPIDFAAAFCDYQELFKMPTFSNPFG